jgi:hypothetical protein
VNKAQPQTMSGPVFDRSYRVAGAHVYTRMRGGRALNLAAAAIAAIMEATTIDRA